MAATKTEVETTVSQNLNKRVPLNEYTKCKGKAPSPSQGAHSEQVMMMKGKEITFKDMDVQDNITIEEEVHEDSALDASIEDEEKWLTHFLVTEFDGFSKELEQTQAENEMIQLKKKEKNHTVGKEHVYFYPSPVAIGTSEYDIQFEDALDLIKKHVKTEDILEIEANGELTVTEEQLDKPVSQTNDTKEEEEDHENTALAVLKEDDMKWLTHFLFTELDELFIASQEREKEQDVVERSIIVKKSVTNKQICKQTVMKQNQKQVVSEKQIKTEQIETTQITRRQVVRRRELYWYPLPAAVGSPEFNIWIEDVLDTLKKHVKIDDIVEQPKDTEDNLPVINFSVSEYVRSLDQDNTLVDTEK